MSDLFYPQLTSGALAQYPIRKTLSVRTVRNAFADGSDLLYADGTGSTIAWQLSYQELSPVDLGSLQAFYTTCCGPLRAFTFIDPTDNMLAWTTDLTNVTWSAPQTVQVISDIPDPNGGSDAFTIINNSQVSQGIEQSLTVPANYQYCLSLFVRSTQGATLSLQRRGSTATTTNSFQITSSWKRVVSTGQLNDGGTLFTIALSTDPGDQVDVYGLQLDAQVSPSDYRSTGARNGIYRNAHWGVDQLPIVATSFDQYATTFLIESAL